MIMLEIKKLLGKSQAAEGKKDSLEVSLALGERAGSS